MKMFSTIAASMLVRASCFTIVPAARPMTRMFSEAQTRVTGKVKFFRYVSVLYKIPFVYSALFI